MQLGIDELIGALPDAIGWALAQIMKAISGEVISQIIDYGFGPLLLISNPMGNTEALAAWDQTANIAIALLPLLIAGNLIAMPFSDARDSDGGLWGQLLRGVGILVFIAISKPLWGFAIDAVNAVTLELLPPTFKLTFASDLLDGWGTLLGLFLYPTVAFMMFFSFVLSELLLVMRWLVVWMVFIGAPLFAVLWYPNTGPMKSVSKFAAVFLRMGLYMLLAGPVIAIVLRVFAVIMSGGVITGTGGVAGTIHELGVSIVLVVAMPLFLFVVVYKTVSWAGQPLGVGEAFGMAIAATVAAVGAATAIAGGAAVAGGGAAAAGGGGAAASGSSGAAGAAGGSSASGAGAAASGASGSSGAVDPSAATDNSTIGSGLRQSIGDSLATRQAEPQAEADAPSPSERLGTWARSKRGALPGSGFTGSISEKAGNTKNWVADTGVKGGRWATGAEFVDIMRGKQEAFAEQAKLHQSNAGFLNRARETGEIDVQDASDRGLLDNSAQPHPAVSTVPVEKIGESSSGQGVYAARYELADGNQGSLNITGAHKTELQRADTAGGAADTWAQRTSDARFVGGKAKKAAKVSGKTGVSGGKMTGKAIVASGKVGTAMMLGGVTQSPFLGHRVGKSIGRASPTSRVKDPLIGTNPEQPNTVVNHGAEAPIESSINPLGAERAVDPLFNDEQFGNSSTESGDTGRKA